MGKAYVVRSYGGVVVVGKGFKRIVSVCEIAVRKALSVLPKTTSPLEVTGFDGFVLRVGVETFVEACSTWWRLYAVESSVDLVGISALIWMSITVVLLKSLSRLV